MFKGWRTWIFNILTMLLTITGAIMQYLDLLGLNESTAALIGMCIAIFNGIANMYLRTITTTPLGKKL